MEILKKKKSTTSHRSEWICQREFVCTGAGLSQNGCGRVLLVSESDLYLYHPRRGGGLWVTSTHICFTCPKCGRETDVEPILALREIKISGWRDSRKVKW